MKITEHIVEILATLGREVDLARQERDEARLFHELRERQRDLLQEYADRLTAREQV